MGEFNASVIRLWPKGGGNGVVFQVRNTIHPKVGGDWQERGTPAVKLCKIDKGVKGGGTPKGKSFTNFASYIGNLPFGREGYCTGKLEKKK